MTTTRKPEFERFINKVNKTETCWLWTGATYRRGYGHFGRHINNNWVMFKTHRYAYEYYKGPIPKGSFVCHTCDVPNCVNPEHLFVGSLQDNNQDRHKKGRTSFGRDRKHTWLSFTIAEQIRETYKKNPNLTYKQLGILFNTSAPQVYRVIQNKIWKLKL